MALLEARRVSYAYDKRNVLNDISFSMQRGEIVGLLGPNGAGKSTLFKLLTGLRPISSGEIIFEKNRVGRANRTINDQMRSKIGVVFQANSLDTKLSVQSNLRLSAELYGLKRSEADKHIEEGLSALFIADTLHRQVKNLSGGTQRKVELVRSLLHKPELLLLDEPSAGFDVGGFRLFWDWLVKLRKGFGLSVLIATHRAEEGQKCDRLLVLNEGRVVAFETPAQLLSRLRDDIVTLKLVSDIPRDQEADVLRICTERFSQSFIQSVNNVVKFQCEEGSTLVPRIIEAFPRESIESVQVKRPSLDDVFLAITGARLLDDGKSV